MDLNINLDISNNKKVIITSCVKPIFLPNKSEVYIIGNPYFKGLKIGKEFLFQNDCSTLLTDFTGNFFIVLHDPLKESLYLFTDFGNSYHPYYYLSHNNEKFHLNLRIESLYQNIDDKNKPRVDYVSIIDYMLNRSITYPFTFYEEIKEIPFASTITINYSSSKIHFDQKPYWQPSCRNDEVCSDQKYLSEKLNNSIISSISERLSGLKDIGIFLSGGIDSRVIAEVISQNYRDLNVRCFTIYDSYNYEVEIASSVCDKLGFEHIPLLRNEEYFPSLIKSTHDLEGGHCHFEWASYLGFNTIVNNHNLDAVFGGYMSDSLLKLHEDRVRAKHIFGRHCGVIEEFDNSSIEDLRGGRNYINKFSFLFDQELLDELIIRRKNLFEYWENLRTDGSAYEWSFIFPFSRNKMNTNLTSNIFQFPGCEIYTDQRVIEIAKIASRKIKLNGRLFNDAAYPIIQDTRDIPFPSTNIGLIKNQFLRESTLIARNLLPRKWFSQKKRKVSSKGGHWILGDGTRSYNDIWNKSKILIDYRGKHDPNVLENQIFKKSSYSIFDTSRYKDLSKETSRHIMSTMISLNALIESK